MDNKNANLKKQENKNMTYMSKCYLLQLHLQGGEHARFALKQSQQQHCSLEQQK
jgi:hypothetical protein